MSWRYWEIDGKRFCYSTEAEFRCELYRHVQAEIRDFPDEPTFAMGIPEAAAALGVEPMRVALMIRRVHQHAGGQRERVDGKLTNRCWGCGRTLKNRGYRAWVERPYTEAELRKADSSLRATVQLNRHLGGEFGKTVKSTRTDTRKEAKQWAYDEYRAACAAGAPA